MDLPNKYQFDRAIRTFGRHESRDAMYVVATYWVRRFWSDSHQLSNGLGVLLLTWNQACYRYGSFDFDELAGCIESNRAILKKLRRKRIRRISSRDNEIISNLFEQFQHALRSQPASGPERYTPVGTVKALHLLAPRYFPLWDRAIAKAYDCEYDGGNGAVMYLDFCNKMLDFQQHIIGRGYVEAQENPLKKIDEFNYVTYTKPEWLA